MKTKVHRYAAKCNVSPIVRRNLPVRKSLRWLTYSLATLLIFADVPVALSFTFSAHADNAQENHQRVTEFGGGFRLPRNVSTITAQSEAIAGGASTGMSPDTKPKVNGTVVQDGPKVISAIDSKGRTTTSSANSQGKVTQVKGGWMVYGYKGSFADVKGDGPVGIAFMEGIDPALFDTIPAGSTIEFADVLNSGFGLQASKSDPAAQARAEITTSARSNLPGLEFLFDWRFALDAGDPSNPVFQFTSNPLLGLDDASIRNMFLTALSFDGGTGTYSLPSDLTLVNLAISVPEDMAEVSLAFSTKGTAMGAVPEPSTVVLVFAGIAGIALTSLRKKTPQK